MEVMQNIVRKLENAGQLIAAALYDRLAVTSTRIAGHSGKHGVWGIGGALGGSPRYPIFFVISLTFEKYSY